MKGAADEMQQRRPMNQGRPQMNNRSNPGSRNMGARAQRDPRMNGYSGARAQRDPRMNGYSGARAQSDPRMNGYSGARAQSDPRMNGYSGARAQSDPRMNGYSGARAQGDPRMNGYSGARAQSDPRMNGYSGARAQSDPRVEAYIRQRREAEIRAEQARRAEIERRRAAAREARRRLEEQLKREKKMRRQRQRKIFLGRAVVCLIVFAILAIMTGIIATIHFNSSPDSPPSKITYIFGGATVRKVADAQAFKNGKMYVCFNDVADYLKLDVIGDTEHMKFVFADSIDDTESGSGGSGREETVIFYMDSRTVSINGQTVTLPADSYMFGEKVWVSIEFIEEYMVGLSVERKGSSVSVSMIVDEVNSTDEETVFLPVSLMLKPEEPIVSPGGSSDESNTPAGAPEQDVINFSTDLSAYEKYMDPDNMEDYLIVVNNTQTLDATHVPTDLVGVKNTRDDGRDTQYMRSCAAKALEALFIEMYAAGYTDMSVTSGYRAYATQEYLHNMYISNQMEADPSLSWEEAKAIVLTYSAEPGTSEHQTGLCIDMHNLPSADISFQHQAAYLWLKDNAWKFGFIERFPENKTDVTGISYEPWHWRFVGRDAAWEIYSQGLCLEEFVK